MRGVSYSILLQKIDAPFTMSEIDNSLICPIGYKGKTHDVLARKGNFSHVMLLKHILEQECRSRSENED